MLFRSLRVEEGAKRYALNGKPKRSPDLKGLVPSVAFTPDDLDLVKGAMSIRRAAMDALGSQLSANHAVIKRDYERVAVSYTHLASDTTTSPACASAAPRGYGRSP